MCGRFTLHHDADQIALRFEAQETLFDPSPRYNIAPTQPIAVVTGENGTRRLENYRWGLVPFWAKDDAIGSRMINARAETIAEKPAFRNALQRRRCLIPADGFYEWKRLGGNRKEPMHIRREDTGLFAFAGLWEEWKNPDTGAVLRTCAIITVSPNALLAPIHDRMPAILRPEHEALWLTATDKAEALSLLRPYPDAGMEAYPVSRLVNAPTTDDPRCLQPVPPEQSAAPEGGLNPA